MIDNLKNYQLIHDNFNDEWFFVDLSKKYKFYCKIKKEFRPSRLKEKNKFLFFSS